MSDRETKMKHILLVLTTHYLDNNNMNPFLKIDEFNKIYEELLVHVKKYFQDIENYLMTKVIPKIKKAEQLEKMLAHIKENPNDQLNKTFFIPYRKELAVVMLDTKLTNYISKKHKCKILEKITMDYFDGESLHTYLDILLNLDEKLRQ